MTPPPCKSGLTPAPFYKTEGLKLKVALAQEGVPYLDQAERDPVIRAGFKEEDEE